MFGDRFFNFHDAFFCQKIMGMSGPQNCFRTYHLHARHTLHHKGCYPSHRLLLQPKISIEELLAYPFFDLMQGKSESLW